MLASSGSRRAAPTQPEKSYGYYANTFLSYGSALMVGYGVWTAVNEINRVRTGTIFSIAAGIAGWIFFRWLNKEKIIGEEPVEKTKPANSNDAQEIKELKNEVAALRKLTDAQKDLSDEQKKRLDELVKRLDKQSTELAEFNNIIAWNTGKLTIPPQSPTIRTVSQDDSALLRRNSSGSHVRRLTFDATAAIEQNPLVTSESSTNPVFRTSSEGVTKFTNYPSGSQTHREQVQGSKQNEASGRERGGTPKVRGVKKK